MSEVLPLPEPKQMEEEHYQQVLITAGWESKVNDLQAFEFDMLETGYHAGYHAASQALQRRVEWTTEKPDKPGYYWLKRTPTEFVVVLVFSKDGHFGIHQDYYGFKKVEYIGSEWAFIPPPHEARG